MNYNGTGTYPVPAPSLDRFDISLEFEAGPGWLQDDIAEASGNIERELTNPDLTKEIVDKILDKNVAQDQKTAFIEAKAGENRKRKNLPGLPKFEGIDKKALSPDAVTYMECIWDEINKPYLYGENRGVDPRDKSSHSKDFACHKVKSGVSNRYWQSINFYANMLAHFLGHDKIEIEHINAVAPYCMSHRLDFDPDYAAKSAEAPRLNGERQEQDLSRRLLKDIKTNYDKVSDDLKLLDKHNRDVPVDNKERLKEILAGPVPDHPTFREYYNLAKSQ